MHFVLSPILIRPLIVYHGMPLYLLALSFRGSHHPQASSIIGVSLGNIHLGCLISHHLFLLVLTLLFEELLRVYFSINSIGHGI